MKLFQTALWTFMCKVLGLNPKDDETNEVKILLERSYINDAWNELNDFIAKSKVQLLNNKKWASYNKVVGQCCQMFIDDVTQIVICTIAQLQNEWVEEVKFDMIIGDEGTKMSEAQLVQNRNSQVYSIFSCCFFWRHTSEKLCAIATFWQKVMTTCASMHISPPIVQTC